MKPPIANWEPGTSPPAFRPTEIAAMTQHVRESLHVIREAASGRVGLGCQGDPHGRDDRQHFSL
jgi:hypothetical protein